MKNFSIPSFSTFLVVGGLATALHYALMALMYLGLGVPPVVASSLGFAASAIANFFLTATSGHAITAIKTRCSAD